MNTNPNLGIWEQAKRMAFWDQGNLDYSKWFAAFKSGKSSVIRQSVSYMKAADLIALIGKRQFIKTWPLLRNTDEINQDKKAILDGVWGLYVAGDASFPVCISPTRFHPKKISTLRTLAKSNGHESIYKIAKMVGRNYRRVHDDIMDFVKDGIVVIVTETKNGRTIKMPRLHGIHTK